MEKLQLRQEADLNRPPANSWRPRCLPYFYIVGAPKTGTTDLFFKIDEHPDVTLPMVKEPDWWTYRRHGVRFTVGLGEVHYTLWFGNISSHGKDGDSYG